MNNSAIVWIFKDMLVMVERNVRHIVRLPQLLIFSTIQPVMFLLLFTYVFGGAIKTGMGDAYINFLLPGILVQTAVFGAMMTGIGIAEDLTKGIIDRFRSLPMARSAVLAGRTATDLMRNVFVVLLMLGVGYLIGFRIQGGISDAMTALALLLALGLAFSWVSACVGLAVKSVETAQVAGFIWVFPLVFASSIFVPVDTMPGWLQVFANASPITITVNAVRALTLGSANVVDTATYVWESIGWIALILFIFTLLATWLYRRQT